MIGLELNDAGLLAAAADGTLVELEPGTLASPGKALIEEGRLQMGVAAEEHCRRAPRQINHQFWDHLAADPLQDPAFAGWSHADLAHAHLSRIWQRLAPAHETLLVAVPAVYTAQQLELLAGIMTALSMPVQGFVSLPLAALPPNTPAGTLLHLDLGLHRTLLTVLDLHREAVILGSTAIDGLGLEHLRGAWMQVIADEFVRRTRFDPFHAAVTEQALYDRLPRLLAALEASEDIAVEMETPSAVHRIRLHRDAMEEPLRPLMDAIHREIYTLQREFFHKTPLGAIFVSHRAARLPGFCPRLAAAAAAPVRPLEEGAAAKGILAFAGTLAPRKAGRGVPFINRRPPSGQQPQPPDPPTDKASTEQPTATHLLYRDIGYPLSDRPLVIGCEIPPGDAGIPIRGRTEGVSRRHCRVERRAGRLVLTDTSTYGTFVDGAKVAGETELAVGQTIRVGTPGEKLQVIACREHHETPAA